MRFGLMKSFSEIFELSQRIEKCVVFVNDTINHLKSCSNSEQIFKGLNSINGLYYKFNPLGFEILKHHSRSPIMHMYHFNHTDAYSGYVGDYEIRYIWYKSSTFCDVYTNGGDSKKLLINLSDYTEEMFFQDSLIMDSQFQEAYTLMCYFYEKNLPKFKFDIDEIKVIEDVIEYIQTRTEIR